MTKAKYPFRIEWLHADGSSHLGGAMDLNAAVAAARDLMPRGAIKAVIRHSRKTLHTIALLEDDAAYAEALAVMTSTSTMTERKGAE